MQKNENHLPVFQFHKRHHNPLILHLLMHLWCIIRIIRGDKFLFHTPGTLITGNFISPIYVLCNKCNKFNIDSKQSASYHFLFAIYKLWKKGFNNCFYACAMNSIITETQEKLCEGTASIEGRLTPENLDSLLPCGRIIFINTVALSKYSSVKPQQWF